MSRQPRILLFCEYGTLNGGEFSILAMLERLVRTDFEFVAAVPPVGRLAERLTRCGIAVIPLLLRDHQDRRRPADAIRMHLCELAARVNPDLVHANSLAMGRLLGRVADDLAVPCTAHLRDIIKLNKTVIADLNCNSGLIAVSQATQAFHVSQGLAASKVRVLYNGVDTQRFRPAPASGYLKRELGLAPDAVLVGNIGQICLRKGQTLLAQAAATLMHDFPAAHYLFVGERHSRKQESVEHERRLHRLFQEAGIASRLHCPGFRDDIPALLNEIDLLVHTAHQEPLGRVLLEAAACGRPLIATNVGGTREILNHNESALLVPPNAPEELGAALRHLLADPEQGARLGDRARSAVHSRFSLPAAAARMRDYWHAFL